MEMEHTQLHDKSRAFLHGVVCYLLTLPFFIFFCIHSGAENEGAFLRWIFLLVTGSAYTGILLLPTWFCNWRWNHCSKQKKKCIWMAMSVLWMLIVHCVLAVDVGILLRFGYHINGLVLNLLFTPGGFESMGLDAATMAPAIIVAIIYAALHFGIAYWCFWAPSAARVATRLCTWRPIKKCAWIFLGVGLVASLLMTGFADFYESRSILVSYETFPAVLTVRMRSMLKKFGLKQPPRKPVRNFGGTSGSMNYPAAAIERDNTGKRMNVIWLVSESLRHDQLTEEIMPNVWNFAKLNGHRFLRHYSGGNGTRMGMFSMFYSIHGANWDAFLRNRQGPAFIDWMLDDGAQMLCQTSAKFTYPEFDKTVFAAVPNDALKQKLDNIAWKSDIKLINNALAFIHARDKSRPFFIFGFFESTHAPYTFPEEDALRKNFQGKINYATVSEKDAPQLLNRYANAAHHVDAQIGRLLESVAAEPELRENTIIIITGDHGEEFYEKGHLGHNSTYVDEQIHPPLVISIPGTGHSVCDKITHHTDIVPTLAPFLRVKNSPRDFSVGGNLLDPAYQRTNFVVMGWKDMVFVTQEHKFKLPVGGTAIVTDKGTTMDDKTLAEAVDLMEVHSTQLNELQNDLMRFNKRKK